MMITFDPDFDKKNKIKIRATVTANQIDALSTHIFNGFRFENIAKCELFTRAQKKTDVNISDIFKYLKNAWNTERILLKEKEMLREQNAYYMTQWLFPQAYYCAFSAFLSYLKAINATEMAHAAVIRKYSELVQANKLPLNISFYADGIKRQFTIGKIQCDEQTSSLTYDKNNSNSVSNQICQFLRSTREIDLANKRNEKGYCKKFTTKKGKNKKALSKDEWMIVSKDIGVTTLLNLLYRKRIKANYDDIETFECPEINSSAICEGLLRINGILLCTLETLIARNIGFDQFFKVMRAAAADNDRLKARLEFIQQGLARLP